MTESSTGSAIQPGTVLVGKYRIEQVLGQGGMGVVVAAHHLQLDGRVALKFLLPQALGNAEAVARFAREARAAVKIKSEHVARVTDVGTLESGSPYMVMEFLEGTDLSEVVRSQGALPISAAVEYVLQACEAVAEAHALGIVHRDLKPANLFLTRRADGSACVKVLDFGISKVSAGADSEMSMTKTATVMGSPLYMSPEQMASARDVDTRTDIWALGAILHELLAGEVPFSADTMPQLCAKILQDEAPGLRNLRADVPSGLEDTVLRCLRKNPDERYPSVAEFAADLLPFGPSRCRVSVERITKVISAAGLTNSDLTLPQSAGTEPAPVGGTTQQAWGASQRSGSNGARWVAAVVAALLLIGAGVAVALLFLKPAASETAAVGPSESGAALPKPEPLAGQKAGTAPEVAPAESAPAESAPTESAVDSARAQSSARGATSVEPSAVPTRPPAPVAQKRSVVRATKAPAPPPSKKPPAKAQVPAVDLYQDRK